MRPAARAAEHRTVSRVMAILEVVVVTEAAGLRLADLSEMVGAPKSSIHGLVRGLVATGYLREHLGRYYPGPALAMLPLGGEQAPAAYHHALEELSGTWRETAILATLAGESVIHIEVVVPNQMIRAAPAIHTRRPLWPSSHGKVFLAFMDRHRRHNYLTRNHKDLEEHTRIAAELTVIRSTGIAYNRGETDHDLYGIASPILAAGSDVTLAIGLAGPSTRMTPHLEAIAATVHTVAQRLSSQK